MKLSLTQRAKAFAAAPLYRLLGDKTSASQCFSASMTGHFEGYEASRFRNRPGRQTASTDFGMDYGVRESMLSEARSLEQTFSICRKINRAYAKHVIGSCRMKWNTGDAAIDKLYSAAWQSWMPNADLRGRHNFQKLSKIAVARTIVDGRTFCQLDRRNGFLQLAPIEGDRVSSDGIFNADSDKMVAGIVLDSNGRATAAKVWERTVFGQFANPQMIPMNQMLHVFDADRFDSVSGYTHYHSVLNTVRDLLETVKAERLSAKRNSKLALLIKTKLGGKSAVDLFDPGAATDTDSQGRTITTQSVNDVADAFMFPDEDMKAHESARPSEGWMKLMDWLVREIATGLDLPFGVVWHMADLGKPAILFEINQANRTFNDFLSDVIEPMWTRRIVGAWITLEIQQKRLPFNPFWYKFSVPRPTAISIDLGRDSKAGIEENRAGLGTATDWYADVDQEFEEQIDKLTYEARYRECSRLGIPFDPKMEVPLEQIRIISANPPAAPAEPPDGADAEDPAETDSENMPAKKKTANAND